MKKRSGAGNTNEPLESYTFFVEESIGKRVCERLSQNGFNIVQHPQEIRGLKDPQLFAFLADKGYVLLSKDYKHRYVPQEKDAIVTYNLAVFHLAGGKWTSDQMSSAFIAAKHRIARRLKKCPTPFIVRLNHDGKETAYISTKELTAKPKDASTGKNRNP